MKKEGRTDTMKTKTINVNSKTAGKPRTQIRDGADIMGDVGFYTISLSCLPSLINQTIGTFGLDQAELTRDQQFDLILRYKNIYHLLLLTATTIDQTLEKIDSIPIFIKDEPETEEEIAK